MELTGLDTADKQRLVELLRAKKERQLYNKIETIQLYPWQQKLANATADHMQICNMAANRVGKSLTGAYITAVHLTGKYPKDWTGHKFKHPINCWASGVTNDTTRDIVQAELFGLPEDPQQEGTGMVPKDDIVKTQLRRGATGRTFDAVIVKHYDPDTGEYNGNSRIGFKSYEMGEAKFFGRSLDWIWLDEQPPDDIYTQCITRTADSKGYVLMTFTPESGVTNTVHQFMNDRKPGQYFLQATWDDAPHLTEEVKAQLLSQYGIHEAKLRSQGIPVFGTGLVFPVSDDVIAVPRRTIPETWKRICGMDFGWDHPTAVVWCAIDPDTNCFYVTDTYRQDQALPAIHASAINTKPTKPPIAWPHDGNRRDGMGGLTLAETYKKLGCKMLPTHFTNPPAPGEKTGSIAIHPGIMAMLTAMENGSFKVFDDLDEWFEEKQLYHRDKGKIVDLKDDLMAATRYAYQSQRFAKIPENKRIPPKQDFRHIV